MKKFFFIVLTVHLFLSNHFVEAQEQKNKGDWSWGIYSGMTPHLDTELKTFDFIRKENDVWDDYYFDYVEGTFYSWNLGVKLERRFLKNKLAVFSGVQYLNVQSGMDADDYGDSNYMLINVSQNEQGVEYVRVKGFNQSTNYVGIPLGVKYTPLHDHFVNLYIKAQLDLNVLINHKIESDFVNSSMKKYSNTVETLFGEPINLYTTFSFKGGIKLGRIGYPNVCLELGPTFVISNDPSCITASKLGFNFQINLLLPF